MDPLLSQLSQLERLGLRRRLVAWPEAGGRIQLHDGRVLLNFSSNDYLDLAHHPHVKEQAVRAIKKWGCSASASRLMCGTLEIHEQLEAALAKLTGHESALVFGSGFAMNVGLLSALASRDDRLFADRLNHASLVDGARLCGAIVRRFPHNDTAALALLMSRSPARGQRLVVCESVYSMDGDLAPLAELRRLATLHGAALVVDEAHAIGVFGRGGGVGALLPPGDRADLTIGTLGKALGSHGGFVACSAARRELLINRTRSFIYATALPPASVAAALAAVECLTQEPSRGEELLSRAAHLHTLLRQRGLPLPPLSSQIIPIHVGDNAKAVEFAARLQKAGLLVTAIRPPTVPKGTARLRLSVTLAHTPADLELAADAIGQTAREVGLL